MMEHRPHEFDPATLPNKEQQTPKSPRMEKRSLRARSKIPTVDQSVLDKPKCIKILSLNCYLVSDLALSAHERQFCCDKQERAQKIGKFAAQHDVIALQEVWGDSLWPLERELIESHERAFNTYTYSSSLLNVASLWWKGTGGLWLGAQRSVLPILTARRVQFKHSQTRSGKGSSYMLLDAKAMWGEESYLLMIDTHLDPTNEGHSQEIQLRELVQFIGEALREIRSVIGSFNKVAILLCGDFNIDGKFKGQHELITTGLGNGVRDLGLEWATSQNQSLETTYGGN
ncbi:unnamed protein product [Rotaria socialis]|uniref:sphingomyelin phosphodiesterase n=2 Tax=Rotaria socialis TaxID=392032 RepID=A0A818FXW6_9BILA|nr:unnamed protein product [Rotaria socialis]CAF3482987.1 unnamed protein product [Rotaria socialis]CAF4246419.1 unnamed protein product [Rotaria socialis]CAF4447466.1 unnamed protein product [Rotaria socialis]CAF4570756.1 unnamed protein product [Rotaria socialis]